jgi:hypothetical protein
MRSGVKMLLVGVTVRHIPGEQKRQLHLCENLKIAASIVLFFFFWLPTGIPADTGTANLINKK